MKETKYYHWTDALTVEDYPFIFKIENGIAYFRHYGRWIKQTDNNEAIKRFNERYTEITREEAFIELL